MEDRVVLTVNEVAKLLGLSRASAYQGVARGEIPSIRVGRRILVPRQALERMLEGNSKPGKTGSVLDHERL